MTKRRKRRKNKRLSVSAALIAFFLLAVCGGVAVIHVLHDVKELDMTMPYDEQDFSVDQVVEHDLQTTLGFAENLCVMEGDVANSNISMEGNSIGGLFNLDSGEVVFSKSAFDSVYPASITKIMTAILAEKYGNMDDIVTIVPEDVNLEEGSQVIGFQAGDMVSMRELFHGLLIYSGNDAAMAIARQVGGTVENFVAMMNQEAHELGCFDTHFMNPSGLHDASHFTSVYDVYLMLNEALHYPLFTQVMQLSVYNLTYTKADGTQMNVNLDSTDKYLTKEKEAPKGVTVLGGKTGTTSIAGNCLALVSQNTYGEPHVSIVLRAANKVSLYDQMNMLLTESNQ